eukprot:116290_1
MNKMHLCLSRFYVNYAQSDSVIVDSKFEYYYIGKLLGKNIMAFLVDCNDFEDCNVVCLTNYNDGFMKCVSYRSDLINDQINAIRSKYIENKNSDIDNIVTNCIICSVQISEYDWRYTCQQTGSKDSRSHIYCLYCIYNVINHSKQLLELLYDLLQSDLIVDCIQKIVDFVVGKVVLN